ncbi:MAG TPA: helix-turn-helix transcriptional regulator [Methylomusa anaerophila]|uniref:Antitoxin HipB n=1 Tax=Methylomusa anaerophila TaxID=1930071 RepID=A0A348AIL8_9FIRM|nr:helix-turn-helix transcriptional regulator [Methylomusa anaerophila]BBB90916.1 antitoxin HipB [Methylomusa anaerophila]HML90680.1 helix-turn-helix transcriptional regulator [Methylomusa anaerophila]
MKTSNDERYRQIAKKIVHYRIRKGLSQEELADKIGISKSYLSKIEAPNSTKAYSLDVLFAIADGLEIDIVQFFMPLENKE